MTNPKNKTISIIGCGWLGLPLALHLQQKGFTIKGSTTSPSKIENLEQKNIQAYLLQLQDDGILPMEQKQYLKDLLKADILIFNIPPGRRNPNVEASFLAKIKTLTDAIEASPLQKIIFVSATSVYPLQNRMVTELDAKNPSKASGKALLQAEQALQNIQNTETTVLRLAGLYGPNRAPGRFLAGRQNLANGEGRVNLVHLQDCIEVISGVIQQEKWGEVYNVCSDEHPTREVFYTAAAKNLGLSVPTFAVNSPAKYCMVSNKKVKQELKHTFRKLEY
ncbi:MAG: SDR family oxidoreductase [Chitinophagales bacterium]